MPFEKSKNGETMRMDDGIPVIYMNELPKVPPDLTKLRNYYSEKIHRVGMDKINAKTSFGKYLVEFATTSTIHGLNHLSAPRRHPIEKFLAVLILIGALCGLITLSCIFWHRYQHDATVVVLDHDYQMFRIKKPSIIVCPGTLDENKIDSVFKRYEVEDTPETRNFFRFLANISYDKMINTPHFDAVPANKWIGILYDLRPEIDFSTNLEGPVVPAFFTERGICMSVNNYASVYATLEYWLANNWTILPTPEPPSYDYYTRDVMITFTSKTAIQFGICDPFEIFEHEYGIQYLPTLEIMKLELDVTEMTSMDTINEFSVQQRQCKFLHDGGLKMWPIYTRKMSIIECRYDMMRRMCGCHPYYARPMPGVPICDAAQLRCIGELLETLTYLNLTVIKRCGIIENCNSVTYNNAGRQKFPLKHGSPAEAYINLVMAKYPQSKYHRQMLFGFNDFLIAVGGAAGLFLGASVLSFVEIFYYLTVRLYIYKNKFNCKKRD